MTWKKVKLGEVLKQYRIEQWVQNDKIYKQVSILNDGNVILRGEKIGKEIGRKRQFIIDLDKHPNTLIFTRQLLLQGSIGIASKEVNKCIVTENMPMFSIEGINPDFLLFFIKSELFKSQVRNLKTSGTAQKSLHERQFLELCIPLPSQKEQEEIIERCKFLQKIIANTIEEINQQEIYLQQLRQSILQEAVQGKLSEQNSSDEDAATLLKRIKAEKQKLIKEGKLKKEKELPPITEDEIPFELPKGWVWCRLGEVCIKIGSGSTPRGGREVYKNDGVKFIRSQNVYNDGLIFTNVAYIDRATHNKMAGTKVIANDILLNITGGSIGRSALVTDNFDEANVNQHVTIIRTVSIIEREFIHLLIISPYFQDYIMETQTGGNREGLAKKNMELMLIPLPPVIDQKRIVAKVQQLQQQLNQLESQVQQSGEYAEQLLQAVLKEAFEEKGKVYEENEIVTMAAEE
jgi:type I restriction enzyme S subunit